MEYLTNTSVSKSGIRKEFQKLEIEVWEWVVHEKEKNGKLPTKQIIRNYAQNIYKTAGHENFKASVGWYRRWEKRHNLKNIKNITISKNFTRYNKNIDINLNKTEDFSSNSDSNKCVTVYNIGSCLNQTFENFSLETDKLISNIDMINSPSEFFNFSDSFDKSMDSIDVNDTMKISESENACMNNFMKELIDDFGKYFSENVKSKNCLKHKLSKKCCKYDQDFKNEVIRFISKHRIAEAAVKFNVHPNTISIWLKDDQFQKQLTEIFMENSIKRINNSEIAIKEKEFMKWLGENEETNKIVNKSEVEKAISDLFMSSWSTQSHWFARYCCRYLKKNELKAAKIHYSDQFQKLIVNYANKTSQIKTASVFNIARKQIFNWMKNIHTKEIVCRKQCDEKLLQWYNSQPLKPDGNLVRNVAKELCTDDSKVHLSYSWYYKWCNKHGILVKRNCDEEIIEWILTSYDQNVDISHQDVQKKALEIYRERNDGNFKASSGWLLKFCRRYMNLLRRIPPLNTTLPLSCENNIICFRKKILDILIKYDIKDNTFGVMDEIPLKLKPSGIMNKSHQKKPLLRSCGLENVQGTIILTCLSNGIMLPPIITLKDKGCINTSTRYHVIYRSNEVIDESVILFWLENIWFRYVNQPNLLLLDCFLPHNSEEVKQKFINKNSYLEIIPGGCSSKLNPLTQVISPQFQDAIDENCKKWFDENSYSWQIERNGSSLSSDDIINWITKAYENVNTKSIEKKVRNVFEAMKLLQN